MYPITGEPCRSDGPFPDDSPDPETQVRRVLDEYRMLKSFALGYLEGICLLPKGSIRIPEVADSAFMEWLQAYGHQDPHVIELLERGIEALPPKTEPPKQNRAERRRQERGKRNP